ncbi:MAG: protein YgfX [Candidatus Thiodiazotropha sp. L084R]
MRKTIPSIVLRPVKSKQLVTWYLFLYVTTLLIILAAPIDVYYKLPLVVTLLMLSYAQLQGYGLNLQIHVVEAQIKSSGHAKILLTDGRRFSAKLRTDSLVTPWMVLLRFDVRHLWRHPLMVLFRDALPEDEMRRLRILLNHGSFHQNGE